MHARRTSTAIVALLLLFFGAACDRKGDSTTGTGGTGGTGGGPIGNQPPTQFSVLGNDVVIVNGATSTTTSNGTDFDAVAPGEGGQDQVFVLDNTVGGADIVLTSPITINGAPAFTVTQPASTSLAPNATEQFTVTFDPPALTVYTAQVAFDYTSNGTPMQYTFEIRGEGGVPSNAPEIQVQGSSLLTGAADSFADITTGSTTTQDANGTLFGEVAIGASIGERHVFLIHNLGGITLDVQNVIISGANAADFTVVDQPATSVLGDSTTSFEITFLPLSGTTAQRTATVSFVNSDANENPFSFDVVGYAKTPEIEIISPTGVTLASTGVNPPTIADGTDFDYLPAGSVRQAVFTIQNIGNDILSMTDLNVAVLTGDDASMFRVLTRNPADFGITTDRDLQPGTDTEFWVEFAPPLGTPAGSYDATLLINNTDLDESDFYIYLRGYVLSETIHVYGPDLTTTVTTDTNQVPFLDESIREAPLYEPTILDSNGTEFPAVPAIASPVAGGVVHTFTITNPGGVADPVLNLTGSEPIGISGPGAASFSVEAQPGVNSLSPGESTTFQIRFDPIDFGYHQAFVRILSDSADVDPFVFAIRGYGLAGDIQVFGSTGVEIMDGDLEPTVIDGTDFGTITITNSKILPWFETTFTIRNNGNAALSLLGAPQVEINGARAGMFFVPDEGDVGGQNLVNLALITFEDVLPQVLEVGEEATFTVTYKADAAGYNQVTVNIPTDDPNEEIFSFAIVNYGTQPEPVLYGNNIEITSGDATPRILDFTHFGDVDGGVDDAGNTYGDNEGFGHSDEYVETRTYTIENVGDDVLTIVAPLPGMSPRSYADAVDGEPQLVWFVPGSRPNHTAVVGDGVIIGQLPDAASEEGQYLQGEASSTLGYNYAGNVYAEEGADVYNDKLLLEELGGSNNIILFPGYSSASDAAKEEFHNLRKYDEFQYIVGGSLYVTRIKWVGEGWLQVWDPVVGTNGYTYVKDGQGRDTPEVASVVVRNGTTSGYEVNMRVTRQPATDMLDPGERVDFTVTYRPRSSNAAGDEDHILGFYYSGVGSGLYTTTLRATRHFTDVRVEDFTNATPAVPDAGAAVADGSAATSMGTVAVGSSVTQTFIIRNISGTPDLINPLDGFKGAGAVVRLLDSANGWVRVSGVDDTDFTVDTSAIATKITPVDDGTGRLVVDIPDGDYVTFDVTFSPNAPGFREATLIIKTNDGQHANYAVNVYGIGSDLASPTSVQ